MLDNNSNDSVNQEKKKKTLIITISLLVLFSIFLVIIYKLINKFNFTNQAFILSDNSTLLFLDDNTYVLNYQDSNEEIKMVGKYKISIDNDINENVKYEYKVYIDELSDDKYNLGFLELQNEEIYINGEKQDEGHINTYYILKIYNEDSKLVFNGYNVDTGIKIKFIQQKGQFNKYYKELVKNTIDDINSVF